MLKLRWPDEVVGEPATWTFDKVDQVIDRLPSDELPDFRFAETTGVVLKLNQLGLEKVCALKSERELILA